MPGIIGVAGKAADITVLPRMLARLAHHPWYTCHRWHDPGRGVALGCVSLGFVNTAPQPAASADSLKRAVLGGEVYGYTAHRRRLEMAGRVFRTDSHAELLLHGLQEEGPDFLRGLEGCFAAAVWDGEAYALTLANDCFGMRPLYYAHLPGRFLFGSEVKALLADPELSRSIDPRGLAQFFTFGHYLGEETSLAAVRLLPAAAVLTYDAEADRVRLHRYARVGESWRLDGASRAAALDRIDAAFKRSVDRCTESCAKLGLSLSGGLDARTLIGATERGRPVTTMCLGMEGSMDVRAAARLAELVDRPHHTHTLDTKFLDRFEDHMRHMVHLTDGQYLCQCIVMPTLPLYRELGIEVLLRGHAGELMHMGKAYNFSLDRQALSLTGPVLEDWLWRRLQAYMLDGVEGDLFVPAYQRDLGRLARESLRDCLRESEGVEPPVHRIWHLFISQRLRRETALSMVEFGSVVETRLPYIDTGLLDALMAAPPELKLGDAIQSYILRQRMPSFLEVINANTGARMGAGQLVKAFARLRMKVLGKLGVKGYQPYERLGLWLRRELRPLVERILLDDRCLARGVFNPAVVHCVVANHMAKRRNHTYLLLAMMIFELGQREFTDGDSFSDRGPDALNGDSLSPSLTFVQSASR
jgi:asparagine synthase (glutamine-hydrolysing)